MTDGFGFPFGCVAAVAAAIVASLAGATAHPWYALVTLGAVVLGATFRTSFAAAAGIALVAWALHTGFILGHAGELRFDPPSAIAAIILASLLITGTLTHTAVSSLQSRVSSLQTREPTLRAREFAGRALPTP